MHDRQKVTRTARYGTRATRNTRFRDVVHGAAGIVGAEGNPKSSGGGSSELMQKQCPALEKELERGVGGGGGGGSRNSQSATWLLT